MHGGAQHQILTAAEFAMHRMVRMHSFMMMCMMFSRSLGAAQAVFIIHDRLPKTSVQETSPIHEPLSVHDIESYALFNN